MRGLRLLLFPFSLLYGLALYIRHFLYDQAWVKSTYFGKKVIVIGNLIVGGAGKSPMVEYLLELLSDRYRIAVLSRGYGRKTKGFIEVEVDSESRMVGDEPLQIKCKFPAVTVVDCEDRVFGIKKIRGQHDLVLLDDAFQHRALKPGIAILLFDYPRLFANKYVLPSGDYRDLFKRRNAADMIVITKCPIGLSDEEKLSCIQALRLKKKIPVFFSYVEYQDFVPVRRETRFTAASLSDNEFLLIAGIANPAPFIQHMSQQYKIVDSLIFSDHHDYTLDDLKRIQKKWEESGKNTIIVTTEKDAIRLQTSPYTRMLEGLPLYSLPIKHVFLGDDGNHFANTMEKILRND